MNTVTEAIMEKVAGMLGSEYIFMKSYMQNALRWPSYIAKSDNTWEPVTHGDLILAMFKRAAKERYTCGLYRDNVSFTEPVVRCRFSRDGVFVAESELYRADVAEIEVVMLAFAQLKFEDAPFEELQI